ncbi:glyoxalase [Enterovibrio norvegicus FF-454]|uniref:Glyoxalase n=2 Tax=Enterovibrio norvegicus TaxID=188144 RepID=A0A1E5C1B8_9GAMM|nr:glyoxalase [Enterovibrio norvegicus FF-454]
MNPVGWFEIAVTDMERAIAFYEKTLGMTLKRQEVSGVHMAWFPVEEGGYGATGTLIACEENTPGASSTMIYFSVENIDEVLARVSDSAILIAKTPIGDFGVYAHIEDSEGNRVGLHSH